MFVGDGKWLVGGLVMVVAMVRREWFDVVDLKIGEKVAGKRDEGYRIGKLGYEFVE